MASSLGDAWTLVGVLLTALFTGAITVISWLAYQHGRTAVAARNPIKIRAPRFVGSQPEIQHHGIPQTSGPSRIRMAVFHIWNRSQVPQQVLFDFAEGRVWWPRLKAEFLSAMQPDITLAGSEARHYGLAVFTDQAWPADSLADPRAVPRFQPRSYRRRYLVSLKGMTASGHRVRFRGWVRLWEPSGL